MEKKNSNIFEIIKKINESVKKFKANGFSAEETRNYINNCHIYNEFKKFEIKFSSKEELTKMLYYVNKERDQEISKIFYEKFSTDEYFAPKIDKIHVDTPYKSKKIGNVIETEFEDYSRVSGKDFDVTYSYDGEFCDLHEEFTEDGRLISTCKKGENKKGD